MHQGLEAALPIVQPAPAKHANCHPSRVEEIIVLFSVLHPHFQLFICYLPVILLDDHRGASIIFTGRHPAQYLPRVILLVWVDRAKVGTANTH